MKNRILYIVFMVLIIPLFVLITLTMREGGEGDTILNSFYSFDIVKEDGVVEPDGKYFEFTIPDAGRVKLTYSWDVEEPNFFTCFTVNDAHGHSVYNDAGFQMLEKEKELTLEAGTYEACFLFLADEEDFAGFCRETEMFTGESDMNAFIDQIGFDTFAKDSAPVMELSIDIGSAGAAESPLWMKVVTALLGMFEMMLLIMLLISDKTPDITLKDRINKIGIRFSIFGLAVTLVQIFLAYSMKPVYSFIPDQSLLSFLLIIISVDVIGFPLIYFLCKKIPVNKLQKRKVGFGTYLAYMVMSVGLVLAGSMIGNLFHMIFASSSDTSAIAELLYDSNPFPRILTVGILAPIFEELIFRKILIDRLNKYGALVSVLASGLFFGLFHGNFQQFFFAAFLGCLWAVLYLKSGNIKLTIGLHMMINLGTSVVTVFLISKTSLLENNPEVIAEMIASSGGPDIYLILLILWLVFIMLTGIAGVVVFIVFAVTGKLNPEMTEAACKSADDGSLDEEAVTGSMTGKTAQDTEPAVKQPGAAKVFFGSAYVWAFIAICAGLFLMSYL